MSLIMGHSSGCTSLFSNVLPPPLKRLERRLRLLPDAEDEDEDDKEDISHKLLLIFLLNLLLILGMVCNWLKRCSSKVFL